MTTSDESTWRKDDEIISTETVIVTQPSNFESISFENKKTLVVDTGAIIKGVKMEKYASTFYTTPGIVREIRDSKSKRSLLSLPFELELQEASPESIQIVKTFAKRTGDFASLSQNDIEVIALTYELEVKLNGKKNIKELPKAIPTKEFIKIPLTPYTEKFYDSDEEEDDENEEEEEEQGEEQTKDEEGEWEIPKKTTKFQKKIQTEEIDDGFLVVKKLEKQQIEEEKKKKQEEDYKRLTEEITKKEEEEEDDDSGWITPSSIKKIKKEKNYSGGWFDNDDAEVGCITGDFAMQNVLLHMGLGLISPEGMRVKYLRQWVKRCHACSTLVPSENRQFCPNCGKATLMRVSVETNEKGELKCYYNPKRKINLRGTKFPLKPPKGGRNSNDAVLREDMLKSHKYGAPKKNSSLLKKTHGSNNTDLFDVEYSFESKFTNTITNKTHSTQFHHYNGYGKKNPNVVIKKAVKKKNKL